METIAINQPWAMALAMSSAHALGSLRTRRGLRVLVDGDCLWLRGDSLDAELRTILLAAPATERFVLEADGALTPWGKIVPLCTLPKGEWLPLRQWCELALPRAGWPAERPTGVVLSLQRDNRERDCTGLLLDGTTWADYMETAPHARFEGLSFAFNSRRQVLVRGVPLPPLPGRGLFEDCGLFVEAGWSWRPAVSGSTVRAVFGLQEGESALWLAGEPWQRIAGDDWAKVTRSAVRASVATGGEHV